MRDRMFFTLSAILAGTFVLVAMQPFVDRPPRGALSAGGRDNQDITVADRELYRFLPGNFNQLQIVKPADGEPTLLRITRQATETYNNPLSGPQIMLAEDVEYSFEGRALEITIEARSVGEFAADSFEANYYAKADAESAWVKFPLTREFAPYSFTYDTPPRGEIMGNDWLGIRPVAPDKRRTMEIKSVRFHAIGPKRPDATQQQ
jgi:hypothetical protein